MHSLLRFAPVVVLIGLAAVSFPSSAKEDRPAKYECRWADAPITLDGEASEDAWKHAQVIDSFRLPWLGKDDRPAKEATRAKLLWDREYMYFFAEMDDADLFADVTEHDGKVWETDAFELFFRPSKLHAGYFEFEVNAANATLDAFFPKYDQATLGKQIKTGDFHLESKVKLRGTLDKRDDVDAGWSVEGRIPWADFLRAGGRPTPGEEWTFSLCRCDYHKDWKQPEFSTTAAIKEKKLGSSFHQIDDYTPITFVGPDATTAMPYGLAKRVPVTSSTVVGSPDPPLPYKAVRVYPDFSPNFPIMVKPIPGSDQLMYIGEDGPYAGTHLWRVKDDPAVKTADAVKLFDTPKDSIATDFCFHPKFAENGSVYLGWNGPGKGVRKSKFSRITRYTMSTKPPYTLDPKSAKTIIEWESDGHNGVAVCFGVDGMMYVTSGDGTADSDRDVMGQSTDTLLAKVLRIDVDHEENGKPYAIPKDNPFLKERQFAPETWATGMRNPWRIACDAKTGDIWVGNNGQDLWETAYLVRPRDNYGWSVTEGSHPFYDRKTNGTPLTKPAIEHSHAEFRSLTGGVVYYGTQLPELNGVYLYGDYSTGRVWGMTHDGTKATLHKELATPRLQITAFGVNTRGELLICDHRGKSEGGFYTLVPNLDAQPSNFPRKLSESGLFADVPTHAMKPGVIPYSVNAPFWSDGLHKERFVAIPSAEQVEFTRKNGWNFPDRTVIVKSFALEREEGNAASRKWVETRFFTKQGTEWAGYSYLWNDAGTDAELVGGGGLDKEFTVKTAAGERKQVWHYPSRSECMVCHSRAANFVLGLCEVQMNKSHDYGTCTSNQLREWEHLGLLKYDGVSEARGKPREWGEAKGLKGKELDDFVAVHGQQPNQRQPKGSSLLHQSPAAFRKLVDPYDAKQDLTARAKSWLHANCSSCHVEAGGGNAAMELEFTTALDKMRILDVKPLHHTFDFADAKLIAPGHPERSVLLKRASLRGPHQMPPLSSTCVDERGVAMLKEWIEAMKK
ncbi:PQQ-dependent sugar dehydrogenase [Limnoglobus roseus]|uniref:Putative glucose/L-sorbosone dehydrogenase, distantly related to bacterial beta-galactosidase n=1 Tax=Limnoglobus roseus TaxID=2598579 RepID=A0A5C1A4R2_9BACT|nr:PQQ-dependent sugar dehydrogenase [Limnoglobus roseus]QEL13660.1 putative glucose/L-sorbosone dehydrogenase, distantly related to bacterial beta-galactosidase [Limnoglobus roseus]